MTFKAELEKKLTDLDTEINQINKDTERLTQERKTALENLETKVDLRKE